MFVMSSFGDRLQDVRIHDQGFAKCCVYATTCECSEQFQALLPLPTWLVMTVDVSRRGDVGPCGDCSYLCLWASTGSWGS
jgi:hypothetical protein